MAPEALLNRARDCFVRASHTHTSQPESSPPELAAASIRLLGDSARAVTIVGSPGNCSGGFGPTFQSFSVASTLPVAIVRPSGEKARQAIFLRWPRSVAISLGGFRLQIRTRPSSPPA